MQNQTGRKEIYHVIILKISNRGFLFRKKKPLDWELDRVIVSGLSITEEKEGERGRYGQG